MRRILAPNKQGLEILKPALEAFAMGNLARKIDVANFRRAWLLEKTITG